MSNKTYDMNNERRPDKSKIPHRFNVPGWFVYNKLFSGVLLMFISVKKINPVANHKKIKSRTLRTDWNGKI
jgi:hypothetical protein